MGCGGWQAHRPGFHQSILLCAGGKVETEMVTSVRRACIGSIEGAADQMWFETAVDRRAEAAAITAIASGSQHSTMRAISNRIAPSPSDRRR
jgi:hypothetical protein